MSIRGREACGKWELKCVWKEHVRGRELYEHVFGYASTATRRAWKLRYGEEVNNFCASAMKEKEVVIIQHEVVG
jgi:hypothetical protein